MAATKIEWPEQVINGEALNAPRLDCDCSICRATREACESTLLSPEWAQWDVFLNGAIVCPACGAQIIPHFCEKHMRWHLTGGTLTRRLADHWREILALLEKDREGREARA